MRPSACLIRRATIQDGIAPPRIRDVLVRDGVIAVVGPDLDRPSDSDVVEADGLELLPGFIDVHTHDDAALFLENGVDPKLRQGVTTSIVGNCGHGCAPSVADRALEDYSTPVLGPFPDQQWSTFAAYVERLARGGFMINTGVLVPHTPIRASVLGMHRRAAEPAEIDAIADRFADALDAGAAGVSLGLMYTPANSADLAELTAIGHAVARRDKLLVAHLRNEADHLLASLEEFAEIGRVTGAALHVSHLKVTGPKNYGLMPQVIERLDAYRTEGIDITADIYPYDAGSTTAATLLPPSALDQGLPRLIDDLQQPSVRDKIIDALDAPWPGGVENYYASLGPDRIVLAGFTVNRQYEGRTLTEIAAAQGQGPADALIDLLIEERGRLTVILFQTDPEGIEVALEWPYTLVGSDGLPHRDGYVHPRLYGTFSRILHHYAGPGAALTRPEAIRRMTSAAADRFGLSGKGRIVAGADADLQLIDPHEYRDRATFTAPRQSPTGLVWTMVRGQIIDSDSADGPGRATLVHR